MTDQAFRDLASAMGEVPLETRLGIVFLRGAGADGEISEAELGQIAAYLGGVLEQLGSSDQACEVVKRCLARLDDEELLDESVEMLGDLLPRDALASILRSLHDCLAVDGLAEDEQGFVWELIDAWQLDEG